MTIPPLDGLPVHLPSALVGQIAVFAAFVLLVWALAREAARWVIKILLVVGLVLGLALWAGWLNETQAVRWLERIGDWLITGIRALSHWLAAAWDRTSNP